MNKLNKKILIITYYYKHKNAMASVRSIKLAKYLSKLGCDVTVITSKQRDTWTKNYLMPETDENIKEIYAPEYKTWTYINEYLNYRKKTEKAKQDNNYLSNTNENTIKETNNLKKIIKNYISWLFYFTLNIQEDICMFKGLRLEYKKQKLEKFDVVIATYPNYGSFLFGIWLKKNKLCNKYIADFRDPLYNPGFRSSKIEANYDKKCLKKILHYADNIVCVTKGIGDGIKNEFLKLNKSISIIPNGFDIDDINNIETIEGFQDNKIHFVYTGVMYHGKRCVDMLAVVLKELISTKQIKENDFVFDYAGNNYSELVKQLQKYNLENTAVNHGFISRHESLCLQKKANALLLLTWNEKNYEGVVPGKLYEYMSMNIPIIALITGDILNSEVKQIINETKCGLPCEECVKEDLNKLKEFVLSLFNEHIDLNSNVNNYNYENICKKYLELF